MELPRKYRQKLIQNLELKQNKMKAKQLYKKACEQGNKDSCQNLKKFNFTN